MNALKHRTGLALLGLICASLLAIPRAEAVVIQGTASETYPFTDRDKGADGKYVHVFNTATYDVRAGNTYTFEVAEVPDPNKIILLNGITLEFWSVDGTVRYASLNSTFDTSLGGERATYTFTAKHDKSYTLRVLSDAAITYTLTLIGPGPRP